MLQDNLFFTFSLLGSYFKDRHVLITPLFDHVYHVFPLVLNFMLSLESFSTQKHLVSQLQPGAINPHTELYSSSLYTH